MNNSQNPQENTCVGVFFNKVAGRLLWNLRNFKNTLFYWTSPAAASDSFRFPPCNLLKKRSRKDVFLWILQNFFWQSTSGWLLLKFICELWEVFQNISFIEHLWETAYFMYKLQYFNQQIQWKAISQVLFRHFIQEQEGFHLLKILENHLWRG